jgi:hypothetical protein
MNSSFFVDRAGIIHRYFLISCLSIMTTPFLSLIVHGNENGEVQQPITTASNSNAPDWLKNMKFLASFDHGLDADFSQGDKRIHTAKDLERTETSPGNLIDSVTVAEGEGKYGHALRFSKKTKPSLFYSGQFVGYRPQHWSGTLSLWMKLDPDNDLRPGYCDPILLTDKQWDRSCLFIDFDKELPRDFRLGVFPDYEVWNPEALSWDDISVSKRPMIVVPNPPFSSDSWTHVCFTWENANVPGDPPGKASLYLNGQHQGSFEQVMRFTWQPEKVAITLGVYYIGLMDEVAVFDTALSESQVNELTALPQGLIEFLPSVR